jgi:hypothetical protein
MQCTSTSDTDRTWGRRALARALAFHLVDDQAPRPPPAPGPDSDYARSARAAECTGRPRDLTRHPAPARYAGSLIFLPRSIWKRWKNTVGWPKVGCVARGPTHRSGRRGSTCQEETMLRFAARRKEVHAVDPRQAVGMTVSTSITRRGPQPPAAPFSNEKPGQYSPGSAWVIGASAVIAKPEVAPDPLPGQGRPHSGGSNHPIHPTGKSLKILSLSWPAESGCPRFKLEYLQQRVVSCGAGGHDFAAPRQNRPFLMNKRYRRRDPRGAGAEAPGNRPPDALARKALTAWIEFRPWEIILARLGIDRQPEDAPHMRHRIYHRRPR